MVNNNSNKNFDIFESCQYAKKLLTRRSGSIRRSGSSGEIENYTPKKWMKPLVLLGFEDMLQGLDC